VSVQSLGVDAPVGVYVHVPSCEAKCSYCHFAIDPRRPDAARGERYMGNEVFETFV
jgi:coproporphyrinogen III oxidase-like Fe-S oxidoreductase